MGATRVLAGIGLGLALAAPRGGGEWPSFRHDPRNSGRYGP
jgi:hypothetical protein